ncbi:hypothetical protein ETAA8_67010 [Anatilimnocola aggregata]|uniref:DUF1501 domain-containing protein n=1 Tax=Anatilimnocola aggregata TaxID=2528021 RepID=A0A517YMU6_9BACT|nr:DUF1501 domain-containing protein [Anatilimnocola aggregata]QDU31542.1 hypothetical protein ETAA8_67010 [Anatilimnocola aggregata]
MPVNLNRRQALAAGALTAGALAASSFGSSRPLFANEGAAIKLPKGKAEHCIFLWLGGGAGQIDTWDPKAQGDPTAKKAGSMYKAIDTAVAGTQVCEFLSRSATVLDRMNIVRSVHHEVIDEHAAATNRVHTGRPTAGTVVYPSIGSIVAHERGAAGEGVPAYVLIGYPNVTRGPGFLGAKHSYIYLTDTKSGPVGLSRPPEITSERQARREKLLAEVRQHYSAAKTDETIKNYDATIEEMLKLAGPNFGKVFALENEADTLRNRYGGEFGQRCLLARRLCQSGVRFVEVSHNLNFLNGTGWDVHNDGMLKQHDLITELDHALATLVEDLEQQKMLDKTLIVVATEFGRPAGFDGGGGRGHHSKSYSMVLAGGGLKNGLTIGSTDELAMKIVDRPVSIPDFHATICWSLGIDPHKELYAGDRPVPITDGGHPIAELFA